MTGGSTPSGSGGCCACTAKRSTTFSHANESSRRVSRPDAEDIRALMGPRTERLKRALYVGRVARRGGVLGVLRELGGRGDRPAPPGGAEGVRPALGELGTADIQPGQPPFSRAPPFAGGHLAGARK